MNLKLFAPVLAGFLIGCGQDKSHAIYDTDTNPNHFPPTAVEIIARIERGQLTGSDSITQTFGDLYTEYSDLLDNTEWKTVIHRLGGWFRNIADSLTRQGIGSFSAAAEYYQLGSFARPEDAEMRQLAARFDRWRTVEENRTLDPEAPATDAGNPEEILDIARLFLFGDTLNQSFFQETLGPALKTVIDKTGTLPPDFLSQLPTADRALLALAGLTDTNEWARLTTFTPVGIDLIAVRISRLGAMSYRAEVYFRPRQPVTESLKVYVRLDLEDKNTFPVEIIPQTPVPDWAPDRLALVTQDFTCPGRIEAAAVGLADFAAPRPVFQKVENTGRDLYSLAPSDLALK